jgi:hypothetical protein
MDSPAYCNGGEGWTGDAEIILPAAAGQSGCIHKPLRLYIATRDEYCCVAGRLITTDQLGPNEVLLGALVGAVSKALSTSLP